MNTVADRWTGTTGSEPSVAGVSIRRADVEDIPLLTALHCRAFKEKSHAALALGPEFIRAMYSWQVTGPGEFVLLAVKDGAIAGFVAMSRGNYRRNMIRSCWRSALKVFLTHPSFEVFRSVKRSVTRRRVARQAGAILAPIPEPFELSFIAVDERFRGCGIAPQLIHAAEEDVAARGGKAIVVGVYKENSASRRAFTKAGYCETPALETQDTVTFVRRFTQPECAAKLLP
jgi:ribosomal protein S18 acetylase RimI-like enzyme